MTFSDAFFLGALRVNSLCEQVYSSFKIDIINLELSIVYSKGLQIITSKKNCIFFLEDSFCLNK